MARLPPPVTRITSSIPEATASSTPYWMVGLSTSGSISLGCALVTGRKRVPSPSAGKTALLTGATDISDNVSVAAEPTLEAGVEGVLERDVDDSLLTSHVGGRGIFATPAMIGLMELCSHRSVEPLLPPEFTTVGFEVSVRHLAPTAPGGHVTITSRLTRVDGCKLFFDVECR